MVHKSGAYHERAMLSFHGPMFRNALKIKRAFNFYVILAEALTLCVHTRKTRRCIGCDRFPIENCQCRVFMKQAEFGDLSVPTVNTIFHLGEFSGKQNLIYVINGIQCAGNSQFNQHAADNQADRDTIEALNTWAVQDRVGIFLGKSIFSSSSPSYFTHEKLNQNRPLPVHRCSIFRRINL